jgi:transcriptional regulator with XRE-family HTH domain
MGATQMADPAALRRRLRTELRRARDDAQKTQRDVAEALFWSPSKVIRIESGQTGVSVTDLKALLDFYGVQDDAKVAELVEMARRSRKQPWSQYRDVVTAEGATYYGYEASASIVRQFEPLLIPRPAADAGLHEGLAGRACSRRTSGRSRGASRPGSSGRSCWTGRTSGSSSSSSTRPRCGTSSAVRRRWPNSSSTSRSSPTGPTSRSASSPSRSGATSGFGGRSRSCSSRGQDDADVVYLEGLENAFFHDNDERTGQYRHVFRDLEEKALSEEASIELLGSIIAGLQVDVSVPRRVDRSDSYALPNALFARYCCHFVANPSRFGR